MVKKELGVGQPRKVDEDWTYKWNICNSCQIRKAARKSTMNSWSLAKWVQVLWKEAKGMDGVSLGVAIKDNYALYLQETRIKATFLYNLSISRCCYLLMSKLRVLFSVFKLAFTQHNINLRIYSSKYYTRWRFIEKQKKKNPFLFASLSSLAHRATFKSALFQRMIRVAPWVLIIVELFVLPESGHCIILKLPFWGM